VVKLHLRAGGGGDSEGVGGGGEGKAVGERHAWDCVHEAWWVVRARRELEHVDAPAWKGEEALEHGEDIAQGRGQAAREGVVLRDEHRGGGEGDKRVGR